MTNGGDTRSHVQHQCARCEVHSVSELQRHNSQKAPRRGQGDAHSAVRGEGYFDTYYSLLQLCQQTDLESFISVYCYGLRNYPLPLRM